LASNADKADEEAAASALPAEEDEDFAEDDI